MRRLLPLYCLVFFGYLGISVTTPLFTFLFLQPHNPFFAAGGDVAGRTTLLGLTLSLYPLGQFIGSPIIGHLSDHFGRRPLLLVTTALTALFYCGVAWGLHLPLPLLVGCSLFCAGLCEGNVALAQSAIADRVDEQKRAKAFGWINACANIAHIVGPILGGLLASSGLVSWFKPETPFWTIALLLVGMVVWLYLSFEETALRDVSRRLHLFHALTNLKEVFTHRRLRAYYLLNLMIYLAMFGYFRAYPMYGSLRYDFSLKTLSILIAYISIPCLIVNVWVVHRLARRVHLLGVTAVTAILMGVFLMLVLIPQPVAAFWVTLIPPTLMAAVCVTCSAALLSSRCSPTEQGQALGNNQALQEGASALSALLTGALAGAAIWLPFLFYAVLAVATGLIFYQRLRHRRATS